MNDLEEILKQSKERATQIIGDTEAIRDDLRAEKEASYAVTVDTQTARKPAPRDTGATAKLRSMRPGDSIVSKTVREHKRLLVLAWQAAIPVTSTGLTIYRLSRKPRKG